jgi:glycogen debranching enzyme
MSRAVPADDFYIITSGAPADENPRVLKHDETFGVFDAHGDIRPMGMGEEGLYHEGTRFLSRYELLIGRARPLFLSSTVKEDNALLAVDLTNPDIGRNGALELARGAVHIHRTKFLLNGFSYERIVFSNYSLEPARLSFMLRAEADFADVFEVRGQVRPRRGTRLTPKKTARGLTLSYEGLDGVIRRTHVDAAPAPARMEGGVLYFNLALERGEQARFDVTVRCEISGGRAPAPPFSRALSGAAKRAEARRANQCLVETSNEQFNHWLRRSRSDLAMMITETPEGPFPYAGVPWFSAAFGRDALITALETLWRDPTVARGVLGHLAATQAATEDPLREAEPGKILHEARGGEMAALAEIPFSRYYGSVDATPLFIVLAGEYLTRSGDLAFIESIWPNIHAALAWIDRSRHSYLSYQAKVPGLSNQGWKDSGDSICHDNGELAGAPIALCEVQAYVYAAKLQGATVADALGRGADSKRLRSEAEAWAKRFDRDFWCEEIGSYALALDAEGRQCRVRASNAGHCLTFGIASARRTAGVARTLMGEDFFTGWGIRTLSSRERRYNPMSYHNGSVWPHDTALIGAGFFKNGLPEVGLRVFSALFDASAASDLHRLPELFCGFPRRPDEGPTLYPVACSPQAWASGAVDLLLGSCLGLSIDARMKRVTFHRPRLPSFLDTVKLRNLSVGTGSLDLLLTRRDGGVSTEVLRRTGGIEVVTIK